MVLGYNVIETIGIYIYKKNTTPLKTFLSREWILVNKFRMINDNRYI